MEAIVLFHAIHPFVWITGLVILHVVQFSKSTRVIAPDPTMDRAVKLFHYRQVCQIDNSLADRAKIDIDKGV